MNFTDKEENGIRHVSAAADESKASTTPPATTSAQTSSADVDDAFLATSADVSSLCTQQDYEILKVTQLKIMIMIIITQLGWFY